MEKPRNVRCDVMSIVEPRLSIKSRFRNLPPLEYSTKYLHSHNILLSLSVSI